MLTDRAIAIIGILGLLVLASFLVAPQQKETTAVLFSDGTKITAEIADDDKEQELGLSNRDALDYNKGMLFVFDYENNWAFWMKDMRFPIDMIWLNTDGNIVYIQKNAQPCKEGCDSFVSNKPAKYVVEVNSGFADKHVLKIGDIVKIKFTPVEI